MSRLQAVFTKLKAQGKKALIPYVCAGDPSKEQMVPLMNALVEAGANAIELGMPFSDPMADGKTIQYASERALKNGMNLKGVLRIVSEFRKTDSNTPLILMGYANPIEKFGIEPFVKSAFEAGVDGVLVVDYPPQESLRLKEELRTVGIDVIYLLAPTSTEQRIAEVIQNASGFIYFVGIKGVTGTKVVDSNSVAQIVPQIKAKTDLPICVGFGIKDEQSARKMSQICDGVIIGSELINQLQKDPKNAVEIGKSWLSNIRKAIDS